MKILLLELSLFMLVLLNTQVQCDSPSPRFGNSLFPFPPTISGGGMSAGGPLGPSISSDNSLMTSGAWGPSMSSFPSFKSRFSLLFPPKFHGGFPGFPGFPSYFPGYPSYSPGYPSYSPGYPSFFPSISHFPSLFGMMGQFFRPFTHSIFPLLSNIFAPMNPMMYSMRRQLLQQISFFLDHLVNVKRAVINFFMPRILGSFPNKTRFLVHSVYGMIGAGLSLLRFKASMFWALLRMGPIVGIVRLLCVLITALPRIILLTLGKLMFPWLLRFFPV